MIRYIMKCPNGKFFGKAYETKREVEYPLISNFNERWGQYTRRMRKLGYKIVKVKLVEVKK